MQLSKFANYSRNIQCGLKSEKREIQQKGHVWEV